MQIFKSKTNNRLMIPLLVLWAVCLVIKLVLYFLLSMDSISSSCRVYSLFGQYDILRRFLDFLQDLTYGDIILPSIILMALFLWFMGSVYDYRRELSSTKCHRLILGALLKTKCERCMIPASLTSVLIAYVFWRLGYIFVSKILIVTLMTLFLWGVWFVTKTLNRIFSLRRQETYITWSQISLLAAFGLWIVVIVCCLNLQNNNPTDTAIITVFGAVLGWIFQDTIKSVAAFFYLRANGLLQIGDLIAVPAKGIEGFVRTISLTTVTIENWDTTTSAFPTFILHADHFKNSQRMLEVGNADVFVSSGASPLRNSANPFSRTSIKSGVSPHIFMDTRSFTSSSCTLPSAFLDSAPVAVLNISCVSVTPVSCPFSIWQIPLVTLPLSLNVFPSLKPAMQMWSFPSFCCS